MPKDDLIESFGTVAESLPNATFRVQIDQEDGVILCYLNGKMRKHHIRVLEGDRVTVERSVYDLNRGRISRRLKPGEGLEGDPNQSAEVTAVAGATEATQAQSAATESVNTPVDPESSQPESQEPHAS
ncbi:MAG: translation initiation factor IF-1 [Candidatus Berkelbacteria bacterium Gr01-1014_85]|uniref:Translation initiation factor IF-1 n=1 Tax=Candidatus Berkelbacteria bacterium Gr01-1014_85 TaxID=2017150 RepID=A0A554JAL7_9BACT|nr:MAG: translation initiation factor IF-1 [Candidatus Berkelbacteria bacterium Gr01-1014_85]